MKHTDTERLSAAMDGELSPFETRRVLRPLPADRTLAGKWQRYHLMGDVMRGELREDFDRNFADRIMRRIEQDAVDEAETPERRDSWLKTLGGLAIAASVAAISLLTLKLMTGNDYPPAGNNASGEQPAFAATPLTLRDGVRTVSSELVATGAAKSDEPAAQPPLRDPRINSYLAAHAEHAARSGLMARVRIVGFEGDEP